MVNGWSLVKPLKFLSLMDMYKCYPNHVSLSGSVETYNGLPDCFACSVSYNAHNSLSKLARHANLLYWVIFCVTWRWYLVPRWRYLFILQHLTTLQTGSAGRSVFTWKLFQFCHNCVWCKILRLWNRSQLTMCLHWGLRGFLAVRTGFFRFWILVAVC